MSNAPLVNVDAYVFDAYGTLFDFPLRERDENIDQLTGRWRAHLQYT
jgi:FMN phosphatase YigB (HAD superfamily)